MSLNDSYQWQTPSEARQAYVETAVEALKPLFQWNGKEVPHNLRISVGFSINARKHLGVCFNEAASQDGHYEIFVSPNCGSTEEILVTVAHELCHACLPAKTMHGAPFIKLALGVGLMKPARSTPAGPAFKSWIAKFVEEHGEYPAGVINLQTKEKQATAMVKCECMDCGYIARTTKKWIEDVGAPICPCNHEQMEVC